MSLYCPTRCRGGGIGRHRGLKIPRWQQLVGSSPTLGTTPALPIRFVAAPPAQPVPRPSHATLFFADALQDAVRQLVVVVVAPTTVSPARLLQLLPVLQRIEEIVAEGSDMDGALGAVLRGEMDIASAQPQGGAVDNADAFLIVHCCSTSTRMVMDGDVLLPSARRRESVDPSGGAPPGTRPCPALPSVPGPQARSGSGCQRCSSSHSTSRRLTTPTTRPLSSTGRRRKFFVAKCSAISITGVSASTVTTLALM